MPIPKSGSTSTTAGTASRQNTIVGGGSRWEPLTWDESRYAICIFQGLDQSGKTDFALGAPEPILVLTFDPGNYRRGPAKRWAGKDIQMTTFEIPKGLVATSTLAAKAKEETNRWESIYTEAVEGDHFRTIIIDREDETWELFRYDEFDGQQSKKAHHYTPLNSHYKALLKKAEKNQKNLVLVDAVADEWKNNTPTGKMKRLGFKNLGMLSHLTMEMSRGDYDNFSIQVIACRDDATKNGILINKKEMETISHHLAGVGADWPTNAETGEAEWFQMRWDNVMAYLIGGKPDEWR